MPLTQTARQRLTEELDGLLAVLEDTRTGHNHGGDSADQAESSMGVERRRNGEQRIRRIRQLLADDSEIVSAEQGCVHDGCVVTLRYPDDPAPQRYWVGDLDTRDENLDVITPGSPLGRALLGTAPGASVPYQSPVGAQEVEVLSVD